MEIFLRIGSIILKILKKGPKNYKYQLKTGFIRFLSGFKIQIVCKEKSNYWLVEKAKKTNS